MSGPAGGRGRFPAHRWAGRLQDPLLLPGVLVLAAAAAGFVGYRDWQGHRPTDPPGRAARLCDLPTGPGTPLGRLLPDGGQDVEEWTRPVIGRDPRTCAIRVDGRTALTFTSVGRQGGIALTSEGAGRPDAHAFDVAGLGASWPDGAAVAAGCPGRKEYDPNDYFQLEITTGEAARTAGADGRADLEQLARAALVETRKDLCP
ncbi:hypothetical protein [Kitasatospora sp. NPDC001547]|uniref:hypothetical protein n=1 Tax=Kitasatospora sp. NPDC001547 TaxID=3364015 RepID=UPI00367ECCA1|nr:hypothetical protein KitaXyl93_38660 [Kitasatospora sp. Xyl93]